VQTPVQEPKAADQAASREVPSADAPVGACERCGQRLAPGQDWCLECGSAQRARRGGRVGREAARAATTIAVAVALLVCGAAAAGYAALTDQPSPSVTASAVAPAPVAPAVTATAAATTAAKPPPTRPSPLPPLAKTATLPPVPTAPTTTPAPAQTKTTATTPGETPGLQEVALGTDAAAVYDPYARVTDQTDPADSYDDDSKTLLTINTAAGPPAMSVGLDYSFDTAHAVRAIEVHTTTPGFSVEVYGAKAGLPPNILDPGWAHLGDASSVATKKDDDGAVTITFTPGRYRHVLLWFTTPPPAGPALAISEVRLLD
jgi:hypothetical protein